MSDGTGPDRYWKCHECKTGPAIYEEGELCHEHLYASSADYRALHDRMTVNHGVEP